MGQSPGFHTCTSPPVPHPQQSAGRYLRPVSSLLLRQFVSYPIVLTRPHKTSCLCVHNKYLPCSLLASSSHVKSPHNSYLWTLVPVTKMLTLSGNSFLWTKILTLLVCLFSCPTTLLDPWLGPAHPLTHPVTASFPRLSPSSLN